MKKSLGVTGYAFLIISAAFLDIPFLGLLAMVTFLVGIILLLIFYLKLIDRENKYEIFFSILMIIGVLVLSGTLGYSAVEFSEYLVSVDRGEQLNYSPWVRFIQILAVNLISSLFILASIKYGSYVEKEKINLVWLPKEKIGVVCMKLF